MKKWIIIVLVCCCAVQQATAQRIRFTDTTNKWSMLFFVDDPANMPASSRYTADTVIAGLVYHRLYTVAGGSGRNTLAVREDTLQGKIYFRFVTGSYFPASSTDTAEHLLFDYGLTVGDTLKTDYGNNHFAQVVQSLDSVRLGSDFYKHWILSGTGLSMSYHFIEGIGTNYYPLFSVFPMLGLSGFQLRCFINHGNRPVCKPAIPLPFSTFNPTSSFDFIAAKTFDNDSSCAIGRAPDGVPGIAINTAPVLSPNPGGREIILTIPAAISEAYFVLTDVVGRRTAEDRFKNAAAIPVGNYLFTPGIYYYTLQDAATGRRYAGRIIFQ